MNINIMPEITKLAILLAKNNVPFELVAWDCGGPTIQIASPSKENCVVDAICYKYSYGGPSGLLEVLGSANPNCPNEDVAGWLTANEALQYFMEM